MANELAISTMKANLKKYRREMPVQIGEVNFMKFNGKTGGYTYGKDDAYDVDLSGTYIVAAESIGHGYIAFHNAKVEHEVKRKIYQALPEISDLPDVQAKDGYKFEVGFTLAGASGAQKGKTFQFWSSAKGMIGAHTKLVEALEAQLDVSETEINPIIKLSSDSYKHSNAEYGRIHFPIFEIVGWTASLGDEAPGQDEPEQDEPGEHGEPEAPAEQDEVAMLKAKLAALEGKTDETEPALAEPARRRRATAPKV